ncbi:MAG: ABC transporter substrate-binding protein [Azospirillaceae bacterium]
MKTRILQIALAGGMMTGGLMAVGLPAVVQAQDGGDVVIAQLQAPPSLDPHVTSAQAARNVNLHMYETLYARDENAAPVPDLAQGVEISEDGLTYVFTLREGVNFHDGSQMHADDVVASLNRYREIGASSTLLSAIESVEETGEYEVTVNLSEVQSTFLDNLSSPRAPIAVIPAEQAVMGANEIEFIGTGPFRFVEFQPDSFVRLERFDDYSLNTNYSERDGLAGYKEVFIDSVTFRFITESGSRVAGLETGEIHLLETVDGPSAQRLAENDQYVVYDVLPFAFQVIKFNHAQSPTDDVEFRLAVSAALDMEEIMAISHPDIYEIDGGWLFTNSAFYSDAALDLYNIADLEVARQHLENSSYDGETLTFIVDNGRANVDTATIVQQRLAAIGVTVELSVADWPTVSQIGFTPDGWHFWTHGFGIEPFEGPASVIAPWVDGVSMQADDPEINRLYNALTTEMDADARAAIFAEFQAYMYENAVAIKAGNYGLFQVSTAALENFVPFRIPRMWGVRLNQ